MIIMNACSTVKIRLDDTNEFNLFSTTPDRKRDFQLHLLDGVIVDQATAYFLRDFPIEWIRSEDRLLSVKVDAPEAVCRDFIESRIVDAKVLLNDE